MGVLVNAQHMEVGLANRQVPASYFAPLADGSRLRIVFKVTFGGSANVADAVTFPLRTYTGGKVPTTFTEDFESFDNYTTIPVNGVVHLAFMDLTNLYGPVSIRLHGYPPGSAPVEGKAIELSYNSRIKVEFHFPIRSIRLGCRTGGALCLLNYFDADRKLLHTQTTPPLGGATGAWFEYSRDRAEIKSIEFTDRGSGTYLDNITVET